jgi:N6-adenosine-specific RNA methylase IME4
LSVSERSIETARKVERDGAPELVAAVDSGTASVSAAAEIATLPKPEQVEIVARGEKEILERAKAIRAEKAAAKGQTRQQKEAALAENIRAAASRLGEQRYGVILADPPWRFEPYSRTTGMDRAADNHYPTMTLDEIEALSVPSASDCVLFLWATAPMLPQALSVMQAWGFTYKSHLIWVKDRLGTGYWARNKHELLLIGTRGGIPAPEPGTQPESAISAPVGAHSAKPEQFHEIIERLYPTVPRLEMFARAQRDGWDAWGAEAEG